ncbi:hypothetical protein L1049_000488 [Liquidambar formosana]|uniref:DUF3741 domain-containing protein n=1 Tax=Liquidambar formosana TaxID=63359 RepID=A0AAP0N8V7_LIQFO
MPQDSLRSVVYRSFVTCDDPKGVVECGTIRKSKAGYQKMEHKMESRRTPKNLNASSSAYKGGGQEDVVSMGISEDSRNPSSFQLLEVSRGVQKLNQMTESLSKRLSFDGQSKDIAKDLLRGALDLQESLVMLGKLQEASQYMAKLKRKQEKSERGRVDEMEVERTNSNRFGEQNYQMGFQKPRLSADGSSRNFVEELKKVDEVGIERTNSSQFGYQNYQMGFQKPRLSADGSSRDCVEELKKVIRDSLARQNLLPNTANEEKAYYDRRKLDLASDIPSTSSSGSSMVHSYNSGSTDSPLSSGVPRKKAKGSNLIAKLMGLEEFPSRPLQNAPQKHMEREKVPNHQRPVFDIDMPKARKPQFVVQKVDSERRTLEEILETMQFKGLLRINSVRGHASQTHRSSTAHSKQKSIDGMPPIVIIKPLHFPCLEAEKPLTAKFIQKEGSLNTKEMLRKVKVKEELPPTTIRCEKGASNFNEMHQELGAEETPIKRLSRERGDKYSKVVVRKPDEKEVTTKEKGSYKVKTNVPVNQKPPKKEGIDEEAEQIQKAKPAGRKPVEENAKSKNVPKPQDAKVTSAKSRKPENKSNINKNQIPRQRSTTPNTISKHAAKPIIQKSTDRRKNQIKKEKPAREDPAADLTTENLRCKDDDEDKMATLSCENVSVLNEVNTALADELPSVEAKDASEIHIGEHCSNGQDSLCKVSPLTTQNEKGTTYAEGPNDHIGHNRMENKSSKTITSLKGLLLSSESFLSHAEELFDLNVNWPKIFQTSSINDFGGANVRLSLDYANEVMERKSLRELQLAHPLLQAWVGNSKLFILSGPFGRGNL